MKAIPTAVSFNAALQAYIAQLTEDFNQIPSERNELLQKLAEYIQAKVSAGEPVHLTFICTHNSRRSHLSQIWAQTAAAYYGIKEVYTYSGGTEATAFNPRAVKATEQAGFKVEISEDGSNPVYKVSFAIDAAPVLAFSKIYNEGGNPTTGFGAVMTCTHADENCPYIPGATRISLPFNDPKEFDDTPQEESKYSERTFEIGREIFYAFSLVQTE
jgi:arsenate reductase (thioredoxin)